MSATVAYLAARAVVGRATCDREEKLIEALEEALAARDEAQEDRDGYADEAEKEKSRADDAESDLKDSRLELKTAEASRDELTAAVNEAGDALLLLRRDDTKQALVDAIDAKESAEAKLAKTAASLEVTRDELRAERTAHTEALREMIALRGGNPSKPPVSKPTAKKTSKR